MSKRTTILMAILTILCSSAMAAKKPLKVYILAGQSNMQGSAHKRTFAAIGDDPKTAALLSEILDQNGDPIVCDNAWITYLTGGRDGDTVLHGKVKVGYGFDSERIRQRCTDRERAEQLGSVRVQRRIPLPWQRQDVCSLRQGTC